MNLGGRGERRVVEESIKIGLKELKKEEGGNEGVKKISMAAGHLV